MVKIKFLDNGGYQIFPITDDMIEITDEQFEQLGKTLQWDMQLKKLMPYEVIKPQPSRAEINAPRIAELKQNLEDTDYKILKYMEGQLTVDEVKPICRQRQAWRDEINQLEAEADEGQVLKPSIPRI